MENYLQNSRPEKTRLIICPFCYGCGYTYNPNHQACTRCEKTGWIKWEAERDTDISLDDDSRVSMTEGIGLSATRLAGGKSIKLTIHRLVMHFCTLGQALSYTNKSK